MAYLRKLPQSKYYILQWVTRENGRRVWHSRSTGTDNYEEAMKICTAFNEAQRNRDSADRLASLLQAAGSETPKPEVNLADLWDWYCQHCEVSGEERQQRDRHNSLNRFIAWMNIQHPEYCRVREVTLRIASEYWKHLAVVGKSASTRNNNLSHLNTIWANCHAPMELETNPWDAIKRDTAGSIRYQPFTLDELSSLRKAAAAWKTTIEVDFWPTAIEIGFYTGLRLGDIATLEWEELSQDEEFLILAPNKTKHWDKDRVAVHSLSLPWVQMLPERQPSGYVWPKAAHRYGTLKLSDEFTALAKTAGITLDREPSEGERRQRNVKLKCFHSLRHTFATVMLQSGLSENDLKDQGNWTGTEVIDQHYNHAKLDMAKKAARKVAEAMKETK